MAPPSELETRGSCRDSEKTAAASLSEKSVTRSPSLSHASMMILVTVRSSDNSDAHHGPGFDTCLSQAGPGRQFPTIPDSDAPQC